MPESDEARNVWWSATLTFLIVMIISINMHLGYIAATKLKGECIAMEVPVAECIDLVERR